MCRLCSTYICCVSIVICYTHILFLYIIYVIRFIYIHMYIHTHIYLCVCAMYSLYVNPDRISTIFNMCRPVFPHNPSLCIFFLFYMFVYVECDNISLSSTMYRPEFVMQPSLCAGTGGPRTPPAPRPHLNASSAGALRLSGRLYV